MGMNIFIIGMFVAVWLALGWVCGHITATRGYPNYLGWLLWYSLSFLGLFICLCLRDKAHPDKPEPQWGVRPPPDGKPFWGEPPNPPNGW